LPTTAGRWRRRAASSPTARDRRPSRSSDEHGTALLPWQASGFAITADGCERSLGRGSWQLAPLPSARSASADHQSGGPNKRSPRSGMLPRGLPRRLLAGRFERRWRREQTVPTTGRPTGTSAVRNAEARDRAGALRSQVAANVIEGATLRRATMTAFRRSAPVSTARSSKAQGPTPAFAGAWSTYAYAQVPPMSMDTSHEARTLRE
jgi:hypothetical protein